MGCCKWGYKSLNMGYKSHNKYSYPTYNATYNYPMNLQVEIIGVPFKGSGFRALGFRVLGFYGLGL